MSTIERWEERIAESKPYAIDREVVYQAWLQVKANGGAAGVDGQDIESFGRELEDNLYKLWNRMCSGSYIPKPVTTMSDTKARWRTKNSGDTDGNGQSSPDGWGARDAAQGRPEVSRGLVWISAGQIGT